MSCPAGAHILISWILERSSRVSNRCGCNPFNLPECRDPTTLNRQGPDIGTQYRSAILCHSEEQKAAATASKEELPKSGRHKDPIVTVITQAPEFYRAEEYHQQYLEKHGRSSCGLH